MYFDDRHDAGRRLADLLGSLQGEDVVVLGVPRGGVPVAFEVARALSAPLDVIVVRKLGVPHQPELAFGAIGEDEVMVINDSVVEEAALTAEEISRVEHADATLRSAKKRYRHEMPSDGLLSHPSRASRRAFHRPEPNSTIAELSLPTMTSIDARTLSSSARSRRPAQETIAEMSTRESAAARNAAATPVPK